jgi:hypothetical protein
MPSVSREQFEVRSELEVVHLPTGAVFRAYPYSNTDDMLRSIQVQWGWAGSPDRADYAAQITRVASQLLLEQAHREMERRKVHNV